MTNPSLGNASIWQSNDVSVIDMSGVSLRITFLRKVVLWTTGAYLILNAGFALIRIPPVGVGIPIGELVLIACLCIISAPVLLPRMATEVWMFPIFIWWGISLSRALIDTRVGGAWALRDASQAIESLYLIVGFWLVNSRVNLAYFFKWLRKILLVASVYGLLFPVSKPLQAFSPKLIGVASGSSNSLFFTEQDAPLLLLWAACWLLIDRPRVAGATKGRVLLACLMVAFSVAFSQAKSSYLEVLAVGAILFLVRRKAAGKWLATLLLGILLIGAVSISGIELKGRVGQKISLDFITNQFESISGSGSGGAEVSAEGVPQRIAWWRHIYVQMKQSPRKMIFGLGYGIPLTDFHGSTGAITREPHNSFVSVAGRLGILGGVIWIMMQASLYFSWWRSFQLCGRMQWKRDQDNLLLLLIFTVLVQAIAIGEAGFEVPFYAIPYYLFFGVILRYGRYLRQTATQRGSDVFE
jgi:O-antigen ligase